MLKGDSFNTVVRHNHLIAQVTHLHTNQNVGFNVYSDPNFAATIQTTHPNPSKVYYEQMRSMFKDDLESSLLEQAEKLNHQKETISNNPRDIQARIDGVLYQLQKNNLNYNLSLQRKIHKQEQRKKMFVDDDRLKNSKIQSIVQKWQDKDLFNHESDMYQSYQKQQHQNTLEMLKMQKESKIQQNLLRQREKQLQIEKRLKYEREMELQKIEAARNKIENQKKYGTQLSYLAQQKKMRQSLVRVPTEPILRHNPITNPLQYHVDNPYLIKRMQERQR